MRQQPWEGSAMSGALPPIDHPDAPADVRIGRKFRFPPGSLPKCGP